MRKFGFHSDGRQCGPIDPARIPEGGWQWFDTEAERDSAYVPPPAPVPASVTMFQARAQLLRDGLLVPVEAAVSQAGGEAALAWEYALELRRNSPTVLAIAAALNLTSEQMDTMFRQAALIEA